MNFSPRDAGIPVLTEIIALPDQLEPSEDERPPAPVAGALAVEPTDGTASATAATLSRGEFNHLADLLLERILQRLQGRLDSLLGAQLEARISARLQDAARGLADEIKRDVLRELDDLISATKRQNSTDTDFINK